MPTLVSKLESVQVRLDALARQHKVPGASLGIMHRGDFLEFATGVTNLNTGVEVTPDTLFQIGSNTKVYTATMVMQLVDEGLVDLDAPVRTYLPELTLAKRGAADAITVRMLLTHTSGIEGDYFEDFGRGDDGLERYVASLAGIGSVHEPGQLWSYCNSGFCVAGRLVEAVRDAPYHAVMRERVLRPLGLDATTVLMEEMLAHRYAAGHVLPPDASEPVVSPKIVMSPSQAPAGSMTCSTPREVLGFVRMHLDGGAAPDGSAVLSSDAVRAMQEPQTKLPRCAPAEAMGLGWILSTWDGERVIGHGGGTVGQLSFLQVLPDRRFGVCLLTNSMTGGKLWQDLGRWVFEELADVQMPSTPTPPDDPVDVDLSAYVGTYRRLGVDTTLSVEDGQLVATLERTGALADLGSGTTERLTLRPIDHELFHVRGRMGEGLVVFGTFGRSGRPRYMWTGSRVARRVPDARRSGGKGNGSKRKRS